MKRNQLAIASLVLAAGIWSCSDNNTHGSETSTTTETSTTANGGNDTSNMTNSNSTTATTGAATNSAPFQKADSTFVMKAAMGGMMEVEAGNIAQTNASSDRVKAFGSMMVNDHSRANQELMSLAASHGLTVPTTLPADMQKHLDAMKAMKGKAFDSHYMSMMLTDHNKDVAEFQKQANSGMDGDLKAWAGRTLPTLKMHQDSAAAISKMK